MKYEVELWAFKHGEIREVEIPDSLMKQAIADGGEEALLDVIYLYGQNETQPKEQPSVSMFDVIRLGEKRFEVDIVGFRELEKGEVYPDIDWLERIKRSRPPDRGGEK